MKLLLDMGNSRIKWASLDGESLTPGGSAAWQSVPGDEFLADLFGCQQSPTAVHAANVGGDLPARQLAEACKVAWSIEPRFASVERERLGVINGYRDFRELGVDRWLSLIAAWHRFGRAACVVSCGTAMTVDTLDGQGRHLGGWIVPGPELMGRSLIGGTRGISTAGAGVPSPAPGLTTGECVRNGTVMALALLVDNAVSRLAAANGEDPACVMTGGAAELIQPLLQRAFEFDPYLVLRGLALTTGED